MSKILQATGLAKQYHDTGSSLTVFEHIDLTVNAGDMIAITGVSGAGKSTLGNVLAGMPHVEVTAGSVDMQGKDLLDMAPEERAAEAPAEDKPAE